MLTFESIVHNDDGKTPFQERLVLPHRLRERSRQRVRLPSGLEAGIVLPPGTVLPHGTVIASAEGYAVRVEAADEHLSKVCFGDLRGMARACLHLGNRHVPAEIGEDSIQYERDPVTDELMRSLGFEVEHRMGPFTPEPGAIPMPSLDVREFRRVAAS